MMSSLSIPPSDVTIAFQSARETAALSFTRTQPPTMTSSATIGIISITTSASTSTSTSTSTEAATWTTALSPEDVQTFLDAESREMFSQLLPTVLFLALLSLLGILGNSVTVLVYYRRYRPSSTRTYILAMAGCDLVFHVWSLPTDALHFRYRYTYTSNTACKISRTGVATLSVLAGLLLVAVALDRHILICRRPSLAQSYGRKAGKVVVACAVLAVLSNSPKAILYKVISVPFSGYNVSSSVCLRTVTSPSEGVLLRVSVGIFFTFFLSFLLIMVLCYSTIVHRLWKHARHMRKSGQSTAGGSGSTAECLAVDNVAGDDGTPGPEEALVLRSIARPARPDSERHVALKGESETEVTCQHHHHMRLASSGQPQAESPSQAGQPLNTGSDNSEPSHAQGGAASCPGSSPGPAKSPNSRPVYAGGNARIFSKTTLMLFLLTVVFALSYLPHLLLRLLEPEDKASMDPDNAFEIVWRSFYLHKATNPLIYIICSAKFRRECRNQLRSFCRR